MSLVLASFIYSILGVLKTLTSADPMSYTLVE